MYHAPQVNLFDIFFFGVALLAGLSAPCHGLSQYVTYDSENGFFFDSRTSFDFSVSRNGGTTAFAADLADGSLKMIGTQATTAGNAGGDIRIGDTVSISGLTGTATVTLQLHVTGVASGPATTVQALLFVGGPGLDLVGGPAPNVDFASGLYTSRGTDALINDLLQTSIAVSPLNPTFSFMAELNMQVGGPGGSADFGNTATLELILPPGLSFTSASGTFLSAVPVPASFWLLATAIGVVMSARRHARRSAANLC
jgi:hypothetical protein